MDEFLSRVFGIAILALLAWIFVPRTVSFSDNTMLYPVQIKSCNEYNICDVKRFLPPLKLRVDQIKSEVIWMNTENGFVGAWTTCTIADKENWKCTDPFATMNGGQMASSNPDTVYLSGWSYRLHWLFSLLPSSKGKH